MADEDGPAEPAEVDPVAERCPLAAVPVGDTFVVVCDDGAVFKRVKFTDGHGREGWLELEPLPGTPRSILWEEAGD